MMKKFLIALMISVFFGTICYSKEIVLTSDNTLSLRGSVTSSSVTKLAEEATKLDSKLKSGYPIYLFLYTPGGYIQPGLELIEFFNGLNRPINTVSLFAASMGWQIMQHLGARYVLKYGTLMSHKAKGSFEGEFGGGYSQLDSRYGLWLRRIDLLDKQTIKRTKKKQTLKSYRNAYQTELWLNGAEAVTQGYADQVVVVKCDQSLNGTYEAVKDFGFFKVIVHLSNCPIKTSPQKITATLYSNKGEMSLKDFLQKNGKFSNECEKVDYWESKNKEKDLCSKGKLTLDMIMKEIKKQREYFNRDLKDYIEYSY